MLEVSDKVKCSLKIGSRSKSPSSAPALPLAFDSIHLANITVSPRQDI